MSRLREIVQNQTAHFVFYRDRALFYETDQGFQFPIPIEDAGSATFNADEKAILLMRYIRRHLERTEQALAAQRAVPEAAAIAPDPAPLALRSLADVADAVGAGLAGRGLILAPANLGEAFFDLRSGLLGELFQKLTHYRIRTAIVLTDPDAHGERFRQLVNEHRSHALIRFVASTAEADQWLAGG